MKKASKIDQIRGRIKKRIAKLREEIDGCRGSGNCASDFDQMRRSGDQIRGLQSALMIIRGVK